MDNDCLDEIIRVFIGDLDNTVLDNFNSMLERDQKIFNPYLADSIFVRPFQLYGKYGKDLQKSYQFQDSTLYFIAKRRKMRFILDKTKFENNYLKFSISIENDQVVPYKIPIRRILTSTKIFDTSDLLIVPVSSLSDFQSLRIDNNYNTILGILIDKKESNSNTISFILYRLNSQAGERIYTQYIHIHGLMNTLDENTDDFSEVLYIGQSRKMEQRSISHEKIQQALSEAGDNEDIYLYFFTFKENVGFVMTNNTNTPEMTDYANGLFDDRLNIVEMALINYFKPKYNNTFVNSDISLNKQVSNLLRVNSYTRIIAELSFDTSFWKFGSSVIKPNLNHTIVYKLDD